MSPDNRAIIDGEGELIHPQERHAATLQSLAREIGQAQDLVGKNMVQLMAIHEAAALKLEHYCIVLISGADKYLVFRNPLVREKGEGVVVTYLVMSKEGLFAAILDSGEAPAPKGDLRDRSLLGEIERPSTSKIVNMEPVDALVCFHNKLKEIARSENTSPIHVSKKLTSDGTVPYLVAHYPTYRAGGVYQETLRVECKPISEEEADQIITNTENYFLGKVEDLNRMAESANGLLTYHQLFTDVANLEEKKTRKGRLFGRFHK